MRKWMVLTSKTTTDLQQSLNDLEKDHDALTIHAQVMGALTEETDVPCLITTVSVVDRQPEGTAKRRSGG